MSELLEARGLTRTYYSGGAPVPALTGVDLTIERGEFVAVMGPSGCGKSTLLNLIAGLDRPSAGEVWLDGRRRDEPFGKPVIDALRDALDPGQRRPSAVTFSEGAVLSTDYEAYLLSVVPYDKVDDAEFADLIGRLRIVIEYASLYGDRAVLDWTGER